MPVGAAPRRAEAGLATALRPGWYGETSRDTVTIPVESMLGRWAVVYRQSHSRRSPSLEHFCSRHPEPRVPEEADQQVVQSHGLLIAQLERLVALYKIRTGYIFDVQHRAINLLASLEVDPASR